MGFAGMDEAAAAPGLRTAVDFYTRKADRLRQRRRDLEVEMASVQAELDKTRTTCDQLAGALDEILSQTSGPGQEQDAGSGEAAESPADEDGDPSAPAAAEPESKSADGTAGGRQERAPGRPRASAAKKTAPKAKSGSVMQAIEQLLATSGEPMHVTKITEALGRPTDGKAGTAAVETIRATCKRLVGHGRVAEVKTAVFAIARLTEAGPADEPGPMGDAGLKGAA
ncbi:hypothetical protein [Streptomyces turgidiscabies]|uniref:Regulatory protein n=1 Tax=Streptomyces turgidiscabies TaxID=85558 RepID=A0ABU0RS60_9ACTN|nr:hypothetical protein [Streptomyces turgidiscabies]MDQ0934816.1 hypothetical protein [Streptomyces turgidiscabies]